MKKILVAGAGHGGLIAAAFLVEKGHDVTVFEKQNREDLGHDWEDRFTFSLLEKLGVGHIAEEEKRVCGDFAFVSPSKRTKVVIRNPIEKKSRIVWRKPLIERLIRFCEEKGVRFVFGEEIFSAIVTGDAVVGIKTASGEKKGDLVIDACGAFSPVKGSLPVSFGIETKPRYGDLFYAWRAYFDKSEDVLPDAPCEIYLYHEKERGLSWLRTYEDCVDVLVGRIYPIDDEKVKKQTDLFRVEHPWMGTNILHGGRYGVIPVRRSLALMVADGYAAVGDSAFMTTPMNGMGIDLSLLAGKLLSDVVCRAETCDKVSLWEYNRDYLRLYGGAAAKNEGLKNALLKMPGEGVDFLFDNAIVESSDLAGAGQTTKFSAFLGKFIRGMRNPKYFFALLIGLIKGAKTAGLYKRAPRDFDRNKIDKWIKRIGKNDIVIPKND